MNVQALEMKVLKAPGNVTSGGYTGSYVDVQGLITERNFKFVWAVSPGTTSGTCTGSVQGATDTAGTGLATIVSFTGLTATGGTEEKHASLGASRYLRVLADTQAGKDMDITVVCFGEARYRP